MRLTPRVLLGCLVALLPMVAGARADASVASAYATTPVKQMVRDAQAAFAGLTSVHVQGTLLDKGRTSRISLSIARSGNCIGKVSQGAGTMSMILTDGKDYVRGNAAFWRSAGQRRFARLLAGKWLTGMPGLARGLCPVGGIFDVLRHGAGRTRSQRMATAVHGVPAVSFTARQKHGLTVVYVAATAPHYLLRMSSRVDGDLHFSAFDRPVVPAAPANAIDLSQVAG